MTSKIVYVNGNPWIDIDGERIAPAAFRSFRPKPDNISLIRRSGVRLLQMLVSGLPCTIGNPYSLFGGVWKGEGEYDFTAFDNQYEMFRLFAPEAYYNVMIHLDVPEWWNEKHPDHPLDSYRHVSEAAVCEEFRQAAADFLKAFIEYAEEHYGDRIFAYSIATGYSNEWFDHSLYDTSFDRENTVQTRRWREAIGDPDAPVPTIKEMEALPSSLREMASPEYRYLAQLGESTTDLVCFFAAEAQKVLKHQKLFGLFYGYIILDLVYWNTHAYEKAWASPDIDMLYSPASYGSNRELDGVSSYQYCVDSVRLNGKLYLHENDHRTHLARFPLENGAVLKDCYSSFEEWREVFRRELCNVMQKNAAFWWFDFFGGYYSSPEYEAELTLETKIFEEMNKGERHSVAEIAVLMDPMSMFCAQDKGHLNVQLIREQVNEILRCGAPFEYYNLNDLPKLDLSRYKLLIIPNALAMRDEIRTYLQEKVEDQTVLYVYGSGMNRDGHLDIHAVSELCGMQIEEMTAEECGCTDGSVQASYQDVPFGFRTRITPQFKVTDTAAKPLAYYSNGLVAAAMQGHTVYSAAGRLPWQFFRDIAKMAGVYLYSEQGSGTAVCSQFIAAYTTLTEDCLLHVKEDGVYHEVFSNQDYTAVNGELRYHAAKGQTMLFIRA